MASMAKILAQRANASLSTGPRTAEGKASSSANATKHSLTGAFNVLPHEDHSAFETLLAQLRSEFTPEGEHQSFLVDQMAQARWRIARVDRLETVMFDQMMVEGDTNAGPDARIVNHMMTKGSSALSTLQRYRSAAERAYFKAHRELIADRETRRAEKHVLKLDQHLARMMKVPTPFEPDYPKPAPTTGPKFYVAPGENLALRL